MNVGSAKRRLLIALAFLLPNLIGFFTFTAGPVVLSLAMSFTNLSITEHNTFSDRPIRWIGLDNYEQILFGSEAPLFWQYFGNTAYLMIGIPLGIAGSLALSLLLTAKIPPAKPQYKFNWSVIATVITLVAAAAIWTLTWPGPIPTDPLPSTEQGLTDLSEWEVQRLRSITATAATLGVGIVTVLGIAIGSVFFRTAFYLPSLLAGVPMFLLWKTLYRPQGGLINAGLDPAIDSIHALVIRTPPLLWYTLAILLGAFVAAFILRSLAAGVIKLRFREAGIASFLGRLTLLSTLAAATLGIALVLWNLPAQAQLALDLGKAGFDPPAWLVSTTWAKPALIIMGVWLGVGGANMLLYVAGLSNIPPELYEAADIDGASPSQRFIHVTWPQLAPTTFFIVIMSTIGGLQGGFEQALIMTGGLYDTIVLAYYIYNLAFDDQFQLGMASAVAWVMFIIIFTMTVINYRFGSKLTNE